MQKSLKSIHLPGILEKKNDGCLSFLDINILREKGLAEKVFQWCLY